MSIHYSVQVCQFVKVSSHVLGIFLHLQMFSGGGPIQACVPIPNPPSVFLKIYTF